MTVYKPQEVPLWLLSFSAPKATPIPRENPEYTSYGRTGNFQKAAEPETRAYTLRCRVLGEAHPDSCYSLSNLAAAYDNLGDYQKALELAERVYSLRFKVLGAEHPDTIAVRNSLFATQDKLAKQQKHPENVSFCKYCGGIITGMFRKKCSFCGAPKDY